MIPIQDFFFLQKYADNKKIKKFDRKVLKLQSFSKVFPNDGGNAFFGGVIYPKTYLNHKLGSHFFPDLFSI